jgi:hypothetical protein
MAMHGQADAAPIADRTRASRRAAVQGHADTETPGLLGRLRLAPRCTAFDDCGMPVALKRIDSEGE